MKYLMILQVFALALVAAGLAQLAFAEGPAECEWMASRKYEPAGVVFRDDGGCPPVPCEVDGEAYICDDSFIIGSAWRFCSCGGEEGSCNLTFNGPDLGVGAVACRNNGCPTPPCHLVASGPEVNGWRKVDCRCY